MNAVAHTAPTEAFESPAAALKRRQADLKNEGLQALNSLNGRLAALVEEAAGLLDVDSYDSRVKEQLSKFITFNTDINRIFGSVQPAPIQAKTA